MFRVAHAEAEDNVEQEAGEVGEEHSQRDRPRGLNLGVTDLFCDVRGRIVVCHSPADGKETKQPAKADGFPATRRLDMSKHVRGVMLVLSYDQQRDGTRHKNTDVEDHVEFGHLLHPVGRERVDHTSNYRQGSHDTDSSVVRDGVVEVAAYRDGSQKHLGSAILRGSNTSNLAQEIEPPRNPRRENKRGDLH